MARRKSPRAVHTVTMLPGDYARSLIASLVNGNGPDAVHRDIERMVDHQLASPRGRQVLAGALLFSAAQSASLLAQLAEATGEPPLLLLESMRENGLGSAAGEQGEAS